MNEFVGMRKPGLETRLKFYIISHRQPFNRVQNIHGDLDETCSQA